MSFNQKLSKNISFFIIMVSTLFIMVFYSYFSLPSKQRLQVGDTLMLPKTLAGEFFDHLKVVVESSKMGVIQINGYPINKKSFSYQGGIPTVIEPGQFDLKLKLFGFIPLKTMVLDVVPQMEVIPGGHSVGILLETQGVTVVGHSAVYGEYGEKYFPGKVAGIDIGTNILKINGVVIKNAKHAAELINQGGTSNQPIKMEIKELYHNKIIEVQPKYCYDTKSYRIGLYIRDNAAGVGTITFYEPVSRTYGALGHMITDLNLVNDGRKSKGRLVKAEVHGIQPGKKGYPGEKIGMFIAEETLSGNIEQNGNFGIFGKLDTPLNNLYFRTPIPVALANQIKEGAAQIITVVEGDRLEKFDIKILRILSHHQPTGKGLIIEITDPRLLSVTGGIIQGMSGSPIIQNNKLVGAVTHVFVNDPTRGYGCLAEWMLWEAGLIRKDAMLNSGAYRNPGNFCI